MTMENLPNPFAKINEKFIAEARPNEPILVVVRSYSPPRHNELSFGGYRFEKHFWLGILPDIAPFSTIQDLTLMILTLKHATWWGDDIHLKNDPIVINIFQTLGANLEEPIYPPTPGYRRNYEIQERYDVRKPDYPLEIIIGHEAIQKYCMESTIFGAKDFYLKATRLLGLDGTQLLTPEMEKFRQDQKNRILNGLIGLVEQEIKLIDKINRIHGIAEPRTVISIEGAIAPLESKDDAIVFSWGSVGELEEVENKMRRLLKEATQYEMDVLPWIVELRIKGFFVDVPKFIQALSSRLKKI